MNKSKDERFAIKKYIQYVFQRIKYAKNEILIISDNEFRYYYEIACKISRFAQNHKVFIKTVLGIINIKEASKILDVQERQVLRRFSKERKEFIEYFTKLETRLYIKYPFVDGVQEISEIDYSC